MIEEKRKALEANEFKRTRVQEMEDQMRQHLAEMRQQRMAQIKNTQMREYLEAQQKLRQRNKRLGELAAVERCLVDKLAHTKSIESRARSQLQPLPDFPESRYSFAVGSTNRDRLTGVLYMDRALPQSGPKNHQEIKHKSKQSKSFL